MSNAGLIAFLIVFICIFTAGLLVYTVFFAIHKLFFRKEINLIKKYNELLNGLNSINIFKIQVLAKNDIGNKLELNKYITIYKQLKLNSSQIKSNLLIANDELNSFNLKIAKNYLSTIKSDLDNATTNLKELKTTYSNYTQYGFAIHATFQNYLEIYEYLYYFFDKKLIYSQNFSKVMNLFNSIRKTFESIPLLANKFDYKITIDTIVDLSKKLKTLANAIFSIYRFQIIDLYLKSTKEYNDKIIKNHYHEIERIDLQSLQNLLTIFTHAYKNFHIHYKALELGKAHVFSIQAINAINQVNQFTLVHISTPTMINLSLNEIKQQTDKIILSRSEIINSIRDLKQYFVLEPQVIESFDLIERNLNKIVQLNNTANHITYATHKEKINAVKSLNKISNQIVDSKQQIINSIDSINDMLNKVIKTINDLNDLYICYWQLLSLIKQMVPSNKESQEMKQLIKSNISQIEQYSQEIITNENPDFDKIAYELTSIVEQSNQLYKRITTTYILKAYANKLIIYANRYKTFKQLKPDFEQSVKYFKANEFDKCIDTLLKIIYSGKKIKKQAK